MADNDQTISEMERLLDLDNKAANSRQDLRERVQAKSLENADSLVGLATQQQAIQLARQLSADPTP